MPDVFISYSSADERLAKFIHNGLRSHKLRVFLAAADLRVGQEWSEIIWQNLKLSNWVLFLASKAACQSQYVQQELGMALSDRKKIVPVLWDIDPTDLPGWMDRFQALDLRGADVNSARQQMSKIASEVKANKMQGLLIGGAVVAGLIAILKPGVGGE